MEPLVVLANDDGDVLHAIGVVADLLNAVGYAQQIGNLPRPGQIAAAVDDNGFEIAEAIRIALEDDVEPERPRPLGHPCRQVRLTTAVEDGHVHDFA